MGKDSKGNDVSAVGIPVTGRMGFAPEGTAGPTPVEGAVVGFTLDPAYKVPGLLTDDGGPEWTLEADGDPVEFWQEGYTLPSGLAKAEVSQTYAQTDETVRSIIRGQTADANGYMTIDAGGTSVKYSMFSEEIFKNGTIRRRWAPNVNVASVKEVKSKRGDVMGYETTYKINRSDLVGGKHFGEWLIIPVSTTPSITAATPANAASAATVTITGTGLTGTSAVKFGTMNATSFIAVNATTVTAVLPTAAAGSAQITVTTPNGTATFPYTRGA